MDDVNQHEDQGLTAKGLWILAWIFGVVAVGSLLRLLAYASDGTSVQPELFVWLLVGSIAAVTSGCCAVLVGIKLAAERIEHRTRPSG